jgi:hypothetical protein
MKKNATKILLAALMVFIAGCASTGNVPVDSSKNSITIVAYGDDEMHLIHVGTTAFNNVRSTQKNPKLQMNQCLATKAKERLEQNKLAALVSIDDGTLATMLGQTRGLMDTQVWAIGSAKEVVANAAKSCKTDYALILRPTYRGDYIFGTNQILENFGVYQRGLLGLKDLAFAYANVYGLLIDCRAGAEAASGYGVSNEPLRFTLSKEQNLQLREEQLAEVTTALEKRIDAALETVFTRLGITGVGKK